MTRTVTSWGGWLGRAGAGALLPLVAVVAPVQAQQPSGTGTITGRVTERGTGSPVTAAQVFIVGTQRGAITGENGVYRITGVPAGAAQLRVRRLGFGAETRAVTVASGATATADFEIGRAAAAQLEQVVVTAAGTEQRAREQGNTVNTIPALDPERLAATTNFSQALAAQAPGVQVLQSGGTSGSGSRVRIRGSNSLSLSNEPLIIIDGVRVNNNPESSSLGIGGQSPSRLNDINPEDIDRIEVLKGPAAAGLFGTQAANGVIQIFTKRGAVGQTRWNLFAERGRINEVADYPDNFGAWRTGTNGRPAFGCNLLTVAAGGCVQDSLARFNPLENRETTPFRTGARTQLGVSASGGTERATYYLSADNEREEGIYRTNEIGRTNVRGNLRAFFSPSLDATVSAGYLSSDLFLPENDNNFLGYISNGLAGFPRRTSGDEGYDPIGPSQIDRIRNQQNLDRLTSSVQANWRPLSWLRVTGVGGLDLLSRFDAKLFPVGAVQLGADYENGQRFSNRLRFGTYTGNASAIATFSPTAALTSTTTLSYQYQRELTEGTFAGGYTLTAGSETLAGASTRFQVDESYLDNRLSGALLQQQIGWRDRLFLTGGLRADDNSAFGRNFGTAYFPSAQVSWVVSEEGWFPKPRGLTSIQLRSSYGQSGLRPGNRDAQVFFNATPVRLDSAEASGITLGGIGDPNLRPERVTEYEVGGVIAGLNNRVSLDLTYYNRRSKDALVARRTAPSAGVSTTVFANLGAVRNTGFEALLTTRPVDRTNAVWNVNFNYSRNADRVLDIGTDVEGRPLPPIVFGLGGASQRHVEGYPLAGYWDVPIRSWADDNGDGIYDDIEYGADTAVFIGRSQPTTLFSVASDVTLFKWLRVSGLLDYRGGHKLYNSSEDFRCGIARCRGLNDPTASPWEQARAIATRRDGVFSGYFEDASFFRLRELAVSATVPERFTRRLRTRSATVTLAGQNLALWTDYTGADPEVNFAGQNNFTTADFLTQPPVRRFTLRFTFGF